MNLNKMNLKNVCIAVYINIIYITCFYLVFFLVILIMLFGLFQDISFTTIFIYHTNFIRGEEQFKSHVNRNK